MPASSSKYERSRYGRASGSAPGGSGSVVTQCPNGWGSEKANHAPRAEHPLYLAEHPTEIAELGERSLREREVDGVAAEEREVGEVAGVHLDADLRVLGPLAGGEHELGARVDRDDRRSSTRQGNGSRAVTAAELEDPLARGLPEEPRQHEFVPHAGAPYRGPLLVVVRWSSRRSGWLGVWLSPCARGRGRPDALGGGESVGDRGGRSRSGRRATARPRLRRRGSLSRTPRMGFCRTRPPRSPRRSSRRNAGDSDPNETPEHPPSVSPRRCSGRRRGAALPRAGPEMAGSSTFGGLCPEARLMYRADLSSRRTRRRGAQCPA